MKTRVRRGFTLPEVLVTVTVVAVLAAVVVPAVTQYVNRGNTPATQQDIIMLQNAVNGYVADVRAYPTALSDLSASPSSMSGVVAGYKGPYLSANTTAGSGTAVGSNSATNASFTSNALGIIFSDQITSSNGYLILNINTGTACSRLLALDTLYDAHDGASGGRITWGGSCAQATPTSAFSSAQFKFMAIGS